MNITISKVTDENFFEGEICDIITIDNFMVTIQNSKGRNFIVDFEDENFIFIWGLDSDTCLESLSACLSGNKTSSSLDGRNDISVKENSIGVICPKCKAYNNNGHSKRFKCYNCGNLINGE